MYSTVCQQTLRQEIKFSGVGLHTGETVNVKLIPAVVDTGIKFVFVNNDFAEVQASLMNVKSTMYATAIENNYNSVSTIEHLLAALFVHHVDNCIIQIDGPEVPLMDGCAAFFSRCIIKVGTAEQAQNAEVFYLPDAEFEYNNSRIITKTNDKILRMTAEVDFKNMSQTTRFEIDQVTFHNKIARSKTFVHKNDINKLKKMGLIKGGSLDNAVVLSDSGIINPYNAVFDDDFARHKIIDMLGDFSLCGKRLLGEIYVYKPGHTVNIHFMKKLMDRYYNEPKR